MNVLISSSVNGSESFIGGDLWETCSRVVNWVCVVSINLWDRFYFFLSHFYDNNHHHFPLFIYWYFILFLSLLIHQFSHYYVGYLVGEPISKKLGWLSSSPFSFFSGNVLGLVIAPIGLFFTMGWGIGWVPFFSPSYWCREYKSKHFLVMGSGLLSNLIMFLFSYSLLLLGLSYGCFAYATSGILGVGEDAPLSIYKFVEDNGFFNLQHFLVAGNNVLFFGENLSSLLSGLFYFLFLLSYINLVLFIVNLLPIPPFDGWGFLKVFVPDAHSASTGLTFGPIASWGLLLAILYCLPKFGMLLLSFFY